MKKIVGVLLLILSVNLLASEEEYKLYVDSNEIHKIDVEIVEYKDGKSYFYGQSLPKGIYTIKVGKANFKETTKRVNLNRDLHLKAKLEDVNSDLDSKLIIINNNQKVDDEKPKIVESNVEDSAKESSEDKKEKDSEEMTKKTLRFLTF